MEDAELIRLVLAGQHEQYGHLVQRYQEPLICFLRRILQNEDDAFDCAQEAFITAFRNLWRYSGTYTFRSWLYAIARNKALDSLRKKRPEIPLTEEQNLRESEPGPEELWLIKEEAEWVRKLLNEMPEHYRQALYLRYHQELTYEEIATVLNIPLSRVKTYLHRGKEKLRQEIERRKVNGREGFHVDPNIS